MISTELVVNTNEVHLWRTPLGMTSAEEGVFLATFSEDEIKRANRFHFPEHRRRFIAARGLLRRLLSYYLGTPPDQIVFSSHPRGKPYVASTVLQFNVSHSDEMAVYALAHNFSIGVDIEMIKPDFNEAVAERYFHPEEFAAIRALPQAAQAKEFYRIWACKEAWVKALGEGLHFPLASFSVLAEKPADWTINSFAAHPDYQSAFAAQHEVDKIVYYEWVNQQPLLLSSF